MDDEGDGNDLLTNLMTAQSKLTEVESLCKMLRDEFAETNRAVLECETELQLKVVLLDEKNQEAMRLRTELTTVRFMKECAQREVQFEKQQLDRVDKANKELTSTYRSTLSKYQSDLRAYIAQMDGRTSAIANKREHEWRRIDNDKKASDGAIGFFATR